MFFTGFMLDVSVVAELGAVIGSSYRNKVKHD